MKETLITNQDPDSTKYTDEQKIAAVEALEISKQLNEKLLNFITNETNLSNHIQ